MRYILGDLKNMKKISPKVISMALLILTLITAGGISVNQAIAPGNGAIGPDPNPSGA